MKNNSPKHIAILLFSLFFVVGISITIGFDKIELHKQLNSFHHPILDYSFWIITKLAEWYFTVPLLLFLLFYKRKIFWYITATYAASAAIVQSLKHFVFHHNRPAEVFKNDSSYYFIDWLGELPKQMSFPSGHTTTAFAIFGALALCSKNNTKAILFMLLAYLVGYSRVYLSMHFIQDITFGSLVGFFTSLVLFFVMYRKSKLTLEI